MESDNIIQRLPKDTYIIGGSHSIAKQNSLFDRKIDDWDIMIWWEHWTLFEPFIKERCTIDKSKYWIEHIYICTFEDWSKIDFIIINYNWPIVKIDWYKYLPIDDIVKYKINLIKNNLSMNISFGNKHTKDIIFMMDKYNNEKYTKYYSMDNNKELPF